MNITKKVYYNRRKLYIKKIYNIINFKEYSKDKNFNISEQDVFNIFLIYLYLTDGCYYINLDLLMQTLGKYASLKQFENIYNNLNSVKDNNGNNIIDLTETYNKYIEEYIIIEDNANKHHFTIAKKDYFVKIKESYSKDFLCMFENLLLQVRKDFGYQLTGWQLIFEDEYIKIPKYPGIVTGEFIGQKKDSIVLEKVKKRAINRLKNIYK